MIRRLAIALVFLAASALAEMADAQISVTGEGEIAVVPDMATVTIGARHEAGTADEALARTSQAIRKTISALEDAGIAPRDMQTRGMSISPRYVRVGNDGSQPPRITGYVASNTLAVRVRDLEALGGVLDAVVSEGANTLGGVSFGLQEPDEAHDAARRRAVADALERATLYATAAGVELGPVISISELSAPVPQARMMMEAAMADSSVPVAPGELSVSARINVSYTIAE